MSHWRVGDVSIARVIEVENAFRGTWLLPEATPEAVRAVDWLRPLFAEEQGKLRMSAHSLIVRSGGLTILVDTGIGNDKDRPDVPGWHQRRGSFLSDLAGAGFPRESIDRVVCTHLHVDHVGWNTMLVDGRWVPTFPNARYLFLRTEYEHWLADSSVRTGYFDDSVRPVVDAGLVEWTDPEARITDEVFLEPTFGHTPGHVSVRIWSRGEEAVVSGDIMHHPVQCARPDWATTFDVDADRARAVRREFLHRYGETATLVFGTHFATPSAGHIVRDGAAWRFEC
jgi:glyoxylase-like metal-dependent hydrolase (beta-lactamase superfamily II)